MAYDITYTQKRLIGVAIRIAGSQDALAELSGISQQLISGMLVGVRGISAETAAAIHKATGGQVPKHKLRPDLFDEPQLTGANPPAEDAAAIDGDPVLNPTWSS